MIRFTKMHGLGNDYVYIDCIRQDCEALMHDLPRIARFISDRHFGGERMGWYSSCLRELPISR